MRAYGKITGDYALQERVDVQTGIRLILNLCLSDGFDMFPTLLVTDGSCMIDRRMGIHGHPLEIQASLLTLVLNIIRYIRYHLYNVVVSHGCEDKSMLSSQFIVRQFMFELLYVKVIFAC